MGTQQYTELTQRLLAMDAQRARRVARLVLECRASLRDALAAVEDADRQIDGTTAPSDAGAANEVGAARRG